VFTTKNSVAEENQVGQSSSHAEKLVRLFQMIENRRHEGLTCPKCGDVGITVSYTKSSEERYGIWLECRECGNVEHADRNGRPPGFEEGLIDERFQKLDDEAWPQADKLEENP
jgi:ribosomal protein L37AE/L43A